MLIWDDGSLRRLPSAERAERPSQRARGYVPRLLFVNGKKKKGPAANQVTLIDAVGNGQAFINKATLEERDPGLPPGKRNITSRFSLNWRRRGVLGYLAMGAVVVVGGGVLKALFWDAGLHLTCDVMHGHLLSSWLPFALNEMFPFDEENATWSSSFPPPRFFFYFTGKKIRINSLAIFPTD